VGANIYDFFFVKVKSTLALIAFNHVLWLDVPTKHSGGYSSSVLK
jgi:hypothetical protein